MCTDCIKGGYHNNHEIKMMRCRGGFCDCGDEQLILKMDSAKITEAQVMIP